MNNEIAWLLELQVQPGKAAEFRSLALEMVTATQASEPGMLYYEWTLSEDGAACHIYERYADSAAALRHVAAFGANFAERFMALLTPLRMVVYGSPSEQLTDALAMLGPVYMLPAAGFRR